MKRILFIFFISNFLFLQGQEREPSIYTEIINSHLPKNNYSLKNGIPKEITIIDTLNLYNNETWIKKNKYTYLTKDKIQVTKYKNNELSAEEIIKIDKENRIIDYDGNIKYNDGKWFMTRINYIYEKNKKTIEKINDFGEIYIRYSIEYDKFKNPAVIKFDIVGPNYERLETADYDYKNGVFMILEFGYDGRLENETKGFINTDYVISKNQNNDITKMYWITSDKKDNIFHEFDYEYDKKGNWIKKIRTIITPNEPKKIISSTYRKIIYKN